MIIDVENGHTLHLVERQPAPSQPSSGPATGETAGNDGNRGWFSGKVSFPLYWVWACSLKWKPSLVKTNCVFFFFFSCELAGNDSSAGNPRNRIGQVSHSVVLGTFNVGDQGEGIVPDLSRVCFLAHSW